MTSPSKAKLRFTLNVHDEHQVSACYDLENDTLTLDDGNDQLTLDSLSIDLLQAILRGREEANGERN